MATRSDPTYHPIIRWSCRHCQCRGEAICDVSDSVDARWKRVLDEHLAAAPHCYPVHLAAGLAIAEESGTLPD